MSFEQTAGRIGWMALCIVLLPVLVVVFAWQEITSTYVPSSMTVRNQRDNYYNMTADSKMNAHVLADLKDMESKRIKAGFDPVYDCRLGEMKCDPTIYCELSRQELDSLLRTTKELQTGKPHEGFNGQQKFIPYPQVKPAIPKPVTLEEMQRMTNELGRLNQDLSDTSFRMLQKHKNEHLSDADMAEIDSKQATVAKLKADIDASTIVYELSSPPPKQKLILNYLHPLPTNVVADIARLKTAEKDLENDKAMLQKKHDVGIEENEQTDFDVAIYAKKCQAVADFKKKVRDSLPITYIGPGGETQEATDQRYRDHIQQEYDEYERENKADLDAVFTSMGHALGADD